MMTWNYRVCGSTQVYKLGGRWRKSTTYAIHEVYYDKKGKVDGWTETPLVLQGYDSPKDIQTALAMMLADAMKHPPMKFVFEHGEDLLVPDGGWRPKKR